MQKPWIWKQNSQLLQVSLWTTNTRHSPPTKWTCPLKRDHFKGKMSSSNHRFLGDMLVFREGNSIFDNSKDATQGKCGSFVHRQHEGARLKLITIPLNHTIINTLVHKANIMHLGISMLGKIWLLRICWGRGAKIALASKCESYDFLCWSNLMSLSCVTHSVWDDLSRFHYSMVFPPLPISNWLFSHTTPQIQSLQNNPSTTNSMQAESGED